jgi:hypothetical protein
MTLAKRPDAPSTRRRVWRVTDAAPLGEFVETDSPLPANASDHPETGWQQSSWDLAMGLEVRDATDTLSPEAFDALFGR